MSGTIAAIPELGPGIGARQDGHAVALLGHCILHQTLSAPASVLAPGQPHLRSRQGYAVRERRIART